MMIRTKKVISAVAGVLLLCIIVFCLYTFFPPLKYFIDVNIKNALPSLQDETPKADWSLLEGKIYISLLKLPIEENPAAIYIHNVVSGSLDRVTSNTGNYQVSKLSHDGKRLAYSLHKDSKMQLFLSPDDSFSSEPINISESDDSVARGLSWAPDDSMIVYQTRKNWDGDPLDTESWNIFLYDVETKETIALGVGAHPIFGPDGSLLVLMRDGLHRVTLDDTGEYIDTVVNSMKDGEALTNMNIALSSDGASLAWSNFEKSVLDVFPIISWDPFVMGPANGFTTVGFWPVFSPDGRFLAFEEVDSVDSPINQRLVVFDLAAREKKTLIDLSEYFQEALFVSDWIK